MTRICFTFKLILVIAMATFCLAGADYWGEHGGYPNSYPVPYPVPEGSAGNTPQQPVYSEPPTSVTVTYTETITETTTATAYPTNNNNDDNTDNGVAR